MNTLIWVSSARYTDPLDATASAKWKLLHKKLNREIIVVSFSADGKAHEFTQHVRFVLIPSARWSLLRYLIMLVMMPLTLIRLVRKSEGATLIAQSPFEGAFGALIRQLFPKKTCLIIENHNNFEEDVFLQRRIPFAPVGKWLLKRVASFAFRYADAVRVISTSTHERALAYAPHTPQVRFMTWTNTDAFASQTRTIPLSECHDIVYAGVLIPRKGVHLLLEAFAKLNHPQARLVLVGAPENADYTASLHTLAASLQITERVIFDGAVAQEKLAQRFAAARVMVLPSLSEGLGRVIVEAMWMGTPVIGSRVGGIPDLITDDENGYLIEVDSVSSLLEALQKVFTHPNYEQMGANAREFALNFFSPEIYAQGYIDLVRLAEG